ncbi:MAG: MOSC domain-containing protein [Acidimicrobiia bacterium]
MGADRTGSVAALHRRDEHGLGKVQRSELVLLTGLGVQGDAHCGATVMHRSRVAADPTQPNLRQVHLVAGELHDELRTAGFDVGPGEMGENITTRGIDLLTLPTGAALRIGNVALVVITGLRNPCKQLDAFRPGLMGAVLKRTADRGLVRRAGVMGVVVLGGSVHRGDPIEVGLPPGDPTPLAPV